MTFEFFHRKWRRCDWIKGVFAERKAILSEGRWKSEKMVEGEKDRLKKIEEAKEDEKLDISMC